MAPINVQDRILLARRRKVALPLRWVLFVNHAQVPIHVLRTSAVLSVPMEVRVGTINPGKSLAALASRGSHFVFCNVNTRQPMLFTRESEPYVRGYNLEIDETINSNVNGRQVFLITAPSEVSTLNDKCVESVLTSVRRSVAKIDQLPLPKPLIARLKDAAEVTSDYVLAKEFIVRHNNNALR